MISVGLFEDHPLMLKGLQNILLQNNFNVLFAASEKKDLFELVDNYNYVEIVVLDFIANDVIGHEVFKFIIDNYPSIKVIAYTSLSSPTLIENLFSLGIKGYVNKKQPEINLINAITNVATGAYYLPKEYDFLEKKISQLTTKLLTEREIEIIQFIANEYTTTDIATQLSLSIKTIESHRSKIFEKLDVKNVAGMIREAAKLGYINS
jgi:DNA-binding NarL/FixJ family response regulator